MKNLLISGTLLIALIGCSGEKKTGYRCSHRCEGDKCYENAGKCPLCDLVMEEVEL